jgi:predicted RNA binding protein YcfA (HicA-like mRNA interferase family)
LLRQNRCVASCRQARRRLAFCQHGQSRTHEARLLADGFKVVSVRGSHYTLRKDGRCVIVPHPKKDLPRGTVNSILRQAGWRE